ncbi:MAG TPA: hypothetical protein PLI34_01635 [Saprospiraceae bacterium]|nr:hypothetical protein [Saprospiraceae bacterium]
MTQQGIWYDVHMSARLILKGNGIYIAIAPIVNQVVEIKRLAFIDLQVNGITIAKFVIAIYG